ncbi:hypothetical protein OH76DRAFT_1221434 [Lentinus brumalis]|uniref:Uncharacterized protein n=1 Tax=Lentinus brumalis TaxID=2498619 RepID=A0A371DLN3_9APHY|nr:hypothetical protein OH76DRAFT_1221434 [Polyporus brumalis]
MQDTLPLPSFDDRNGVRGRCHRATSSDSPYAIVHTLPAANKEHTPSSSPVRRTPDTSRIAVDAAGRYRRQTPSRRPAVPESNTGAPTLRPHSRDLDNPWAAAWQAVGYMPPRNTGRTPTPFESEWMSPGYVSSGRSRSRRTALEAHIGNEGFTPAGGIREGDNWHSEEAVRDENRRRKGIAKLRKNKSNECRLKGTLDGMTDRMSRHH